MFTIRAAIGVIVLGVYLQSSTAFPQTALLTPELIDEAVSAGLQGQVGPYQLRRGLGAPSTPQRIAIYTPFVRVALAARMARQRNEAFDVSALPSWVTAPVVTAVFGSPCPASYSCLIHDQQFHQGIPVTEVVVGPRIMTPEALKLPGVRASVRALEYSTDLRFLDILGGAFEHALIAATFEPAVLRPGLTLYVSWDLPGRVTAFSGGLLTEEELRTWR